MSVGLPTIYPTLPPLLFATSSLTSPPHTNCSKPSLSKVSAFNPAHNTAASLYLQVDHSLFNAGSTAVAFTTGPLGMLLRHVPNIGLTVNSFQIIKDADGNTVIGQAAASGCIQLGDVLCAVNGWRFPKEYTAHDLVKLIQELPRPVTITFLHAGILDGNGGGNSEPTCCVIDEYKLKLREGEEVLCVKQAQMKASTFGMKGAAGGMAGVGISVDECSPLQHPVTQNTAGKSCVNMAWVPGVAMVGGAIFLTNYRLVFHMGNGSKLSVDKSVKEENARRRTASRSPLRHTTSGVEKIKLERKTTGDSLGSVDEKVEAKDDSTLSDPAANLPDFEIPVTSILKVECFGEHEYGIIKVNIPTLGLMTKDGRAVKFVMPFQAGNTHESCLKAGKLISEMAFEVGGMPKESGATTWGGEWNGPAKERTPGGPKWGEFPRMFKEKRGLKGVGAGAEVFGNYNLLDEYGRLNLLSDPGLRCINSSVDLYPNSPATYPEELMVPAGMTNDELKRVCAFRSKARIPCIVFKHRVTGATMSRSAQPLVGISKNRSGDDEKLLARIMKLGDKTKFYIMDARKKTAATGNKIMGKGTEDTKNYPCSQMLHMDIANIHSVRDSENLLWDLCRPSSSVGGGGSWLGKLDNTQWLQHVWSILGAGARCAAILSQEGVSVLVHCSDGWDRTAQICSLAEMLLDPYCRTFKGLRAVVEKQWCCFGHKFDHRNGRGASKGSSLDEERSPIFGLFVDCVWTIMQQFPNEFQFNETLLLALLDQLMAGKTGTFLGNCKAEREQYRESTMNVWDYLIDEYGVDEFLNKDWVGEKGAGDLQDGEGELVVNCNPKNIRLWEDRWFRFDTSIVGYKTPKTYF